MSRSLGLFQDAFNPRLAKWLEEKSSFYKDFTNDALIIKTFDQAALLINHGGKRIRPYLCWLAYSTEGGTDDEKIFQAGIGLELFHAFALIHDDIIDHGTERHKSATIHTYIEKALEPTAHGSKTHIGESMALLAGDRVLGWSYEIMANIQNPNAFAIFSAMIDEIVVGQMLDVSFTTKARVAQEDIIKKNELKTALYSFVNPMLIGATLAGSTTHNEWYRTMGLILGQVFQMQDDLLDIVGGIATGKTPFTDIATGQHTLLTQYIFEQGTDAEKNILSSLFGKPVDDEARKKLLTLFSSSNAITYAEQEIERLVAQAKETIASSQLESTEAWEALVALLDKRAS